MTSLFHENTLLFVFGLFCNLSVMANIFISEDFQTGTNIMIISKLLNHSVISKFYYVLRHNLCL